MLSCLLPAVARFDAIDGYSYNNEEHFNYNNHK